MASLEEPLIVVSDAIASLPDATASLQDELHVVPHQHHVVPHQRQQDAPERHQHQDERHQETLMEKAFKISAVLASVILYVMPVFLAKTALLPGTQLAILYGTSTLNCISWFVYGRIEQDVVVENVNLFGLVTGLMFTVHTVGDVTWWPVLSLGGSFVWPLLVAVAYYAFLYGLYGNFKKEKVCCCELTVMEFSGVATTVLASAVPLCFRAVTMISTTSKATGSPLVPLMATACNILWAAYTHMAKKKAMRAASISAALLAGALSILSVKERML
ncbi:uncharacterized protein LOC9629122 isoform X1 [Selaginella moellendorffii]|uniref:uncharacterized protein LOC9629122 isoform X1 n=1 Tax=Selaginella moellendorffii TaxID=88036 RepID=UPI000D1C5AC4|nr:uncharacterized protein LOC9629122 isoform X1 [Selaginella moellendorffii]XP_024534256.1 uncharacterized protein LOC9629122 isoform X1 [Selaginella moellendorffii]XP_024534262.1 uncharacterized protein LOC9629122 isoform X1 [Selaginella moellendorffii]XP_024534269.1 uncharacterized protein LOC9629122 isoform X1 [Selaginella moellendorffii]XP_024534276.1 uncharacterized protein LOC9629122 isoform X1 [Selaginella moellendorffii]XP_024534281.1 uncharacterized protein LOC9629122 isoform X1 [Sel|eukprot:XP_024534250.1 uncharacterized protein LOC9629122 isoform X1 [Selaginella moellendorffii]